MGTRLNITDGENSYEGTKHYGYIRRNVDTLPSVEYLFAVAKEQIPEDADFLAYPEFITFNTDDGYLHLTKEKFRMFLYAYNTEYNTPGVSWAWPHDIIAEEPIQKLLESDAPYFRIWWD